MDQPFFHYHVSSIKHIKSKPCDHCHYVNARASENTEMPFQPPLADGPACISKGWGAGGLGGGGGWRVEPECRSLDHWRVN